MKEIQCAKNTEDEMHKLQHQREVNDLQQKLMEVWIIEYLRLVSALDIENGRLLKRNYNVVLQLQNTLASERKENEESISSLKGQLVAETAVLRTNYESKLQAECNKLSDLRTELGIAKKKLNMLDQVKFLDFKPTVTQKLKNDWQLILFHGLFWMVVVVGNQYVTKLVKVKNSHFRVRLDFCSRLSANKNRIDNVRCLEAKGGGAL